MPMFTPENLNPHNSVTTPEIDQNLQDLALTINRLEMAYGRDLVLSSGYRSIPEHLRIYESINARRRAKGLVPVSVPMGSKHLSGQAVDIEDPTGVIWRWCMSNIALLEELELWLEDREATPTSPLTTSTWVHFQRVPPKSGKRIFKP